jgi:3-oxoacyl-[acyl-carrier-protein] synthase II
MQKVVITGLGAVTPLGTSVKDSWSRLCEGRSGIRPITQFDVSRLRTRLAGQVCDFDPKAFMDARLADRVDRFIQLGAAAARQAVQDARLTIGGAGVGAAGAGAAEPERVGVLMGNTFGGVLQLEQGFECVAGGGATQLSPFFVPGSISNMAAGLAAMALGAKGPNITVNQACASGAAAIGLGLRLLRAGEADAVIAGGCEAALARVVFCGYHALKATTARNDEPERASRPFDRERDGFVPAEGAGAMVLEPRDLAERRGATILAELAGYGTTCDAFHPTRPDPSAEGCARCMRLALEDARLDARDVDLVNAHGTSTRLNDVVEARAIHQVFGRARRVPVTANKSMIGHTIGAAGAIEAVFSVLSLRDGVMPPTTNYEYPDPECELDCVAKEPRLGEVRAVLSNSFAFGGVNVSLVFRSA